MATPRVERDPPRLAAFAPTLLCLELHAGTELSDMRVRHWGLLPEMAFSSWPSCGAGDVIRTVADPLSFARRRAPPATWAEQPRKDRGAATVRGDAGGAHDAATCERSKPCTHNSFEAT